MKDVLLEVNNLYKSFESVNAVDDVSFDLFRAETLGVVGDLCNHSEIVCNEDH